MRISIITIFSKFTRVDYIAACMRIPPFNISMNILCYTQVFTTIIAFVIYPVKGVCPISPRTIVLYVLKVIWNIIVPLINHSIYNTFTVSLICPSKTSSVIIKAVPYLPSVEVTVLKVILVRSIELMINRSCFFI